MDRSTITAREIEERTVPDHASVAAIVAMAMRMRSRTNPKRFYAIPIDAGVTADQPLVTSASATSH